MRLKCVQIPKGVNSKYIVLDNNTAQSSVIIPLEILNQQIDLYENFVNILCNLSFNLSKVYRDRQRKRGKETIRPFSLYIAEVENTKQINYFYSRNKELKAKNNTNFDNTI